MPTTSTLVAFCLATLAVLVIPGPSVAYVVARSIEHGRAAGLSSMLGLETGALIHVAAAGLGLAGILATSDLAYSVLRYAGAGYLLMLGAHQLRWHGVRPGGSAPVTSSSRWRLYRAGILVDLLNPKTALFFIAFLPQFVDPGRGPAAPQIVALGLCFVALAAVCDGAYAMVAGSLTERINGSERAQRIIRRGTGGVYVGLAGVAALT